MSDAKDNAAADAASAEDETSLGVGGHDDDEGWRGDQRAECQKEDRMRGISASSMSNISL